MKDEMSGVCSTREESRTRKRWLKNIFTRHALKKALGVYMREREGVGGCKLESVK
jgi:hypothetical protein